MERIRYKFVFKLHRQICKERQINSQAEGKDRKELYQNTLVAALEYWILSKFFFSIFAVR